VYIGGPFSKSNETNGNNLQRFPHQFIFARFWSPLTSASVPHSSFLARPEGLWPKQVKTNHLKLTNPWPKYKFQTKTHALGSMANVPQYCLIQ
jgi:hypothetical protein